MGLLVMVVSHLNCHSRIHFTSGYELLDFPGQASGPGFSLCGHPSGRGGLGEMVGWAPQVSGIEVMRK